MSGHSKWHNIQVKKGKADKTKSGHFTKAARAIAVAARSGGADIATNFSLRLAIDKAKAVNMPKDNIERAIKRGIGELTDEAAMEEIVYEGFGPGGAAFLIETITDNKVRTVAELKHLFSAHGGSLGGPGSVQWMFKHQGVTRLDASQKSLVFSQKSDVELTLIDAGAEDIIEHEEGIEIRCPVAKLQAVVEIIKSFGVEPDDFGLEWVAKEIVPVDDETGQKVQTLIGAFHEMEDVREVYVNVG